jgi:hypothetical protein
MMVRAATLDDMIEEVVRLRVKPNVFLYAFEASQFYLVVMLAMSLVLMPVIHFKTGMPIGGLMLRIVLTIYGVILSIFFVAVVFVAHCMEFIVTNKKVIVRVSLMRRMQDNISIPIESIKSIEVRSYTAHYGSVYFECDETSPLDDLQPYDGSQSNYSRPAPVDDRPLRLINPVVWSGWGPRRRTMTSSSSPLSGFYGFRHFDTFAKLVAELQAAA